MTPEYARCVHMGPHDENLLYVYILFDQKKNQHRMSQALGWLGWEKRLSTWKLRFDVKTTIRTALNFPTSFGR